MRKNNEETGNVLVMGMVAEYTENRYKMTEEENRGKGKPADVGQVKRAERSLSNDVRYSAEYPARIHIGQEVNSPVVQRVIQPLEQTGPNCGIFAMAMALADLTDMDGLQLASALEAYAKENAYSCLGEMFDAQELVRTGREYCDKYLSQYGIQVALLPFQNESEMRNVFELAKEKETYVLFPYFADKGKPITNLENGAEVVPREKMLSAHWAVIERRKKEGEETERLHILEGSQNIYGGPENSYLQEGMFQELFRANQLLGNEVDWQSYWDMLAQYLERWETERTKAKREMEDLESSEIEFDFYKMHIDSKLYRLMEEEFFLTIQEAFWERRNQEWKMDQYPDDTLSELKQESERLKRMRNDLERQIKVWQEEKEGSEEQQKEFKRLYQFWNTKLQNVEMRIQKLSRRWTDFLASKRFREKKSIYSYENNRLIESVNLRGRVIVIQKK